MRRGGAGAGQPRQTDRAQGLARQARQACGAPNPQPRPRAQPDAYPCRYRYCYRYRCPYLYPYPYPYPFPFTPTLPLTHMKMASMAVGSPTGTRVSPHASESA